MGVSIGGVRFFLSDECVVWWTGVLVAVAVDQLAWERLGRMGCEGVLGLLRKREAERLPPLARCVAWCGRCPR